MNNLTTLIKRYGLFAMSPKDMMQPPVLCFACHFLISMTFPCNGMNISVVCAACMLFACWYSFAMPGTRLIQIMNRLEAATSRLEDIAQTTVDPGMNGVSSDSATIKGSASFSSATTSLQPSVRQAESLPPSIGAFDEIINTDVTKFVKLGEQIGGVLSEQVGLAPLTCIL